MGSTSQDIRINKQVFGDDFVWGVSAAALQIEGAFDAHGKGQSIWDVFSAKKGKILNGDLPHTSCDFYNEYKQDIDIVVVLPKVLQWLLLRSFGRTSSLVMQRSAARSRGAREGFGGSHDRRALERWPDRETQASYLKTPGGRNCQPADTRELTKADTSELVDELNVDRNSDWDQEFASHDQGRSSEAGQPRR